MINKPQVIESRDFLGQALKDAHDNSFEILFFKLDIFHLIFFKVMLVDGLHRELRKKLDEIVVLVEGKSLLRVHGVPKEMTHID